jgi:hypothetical protein
MDMSLLNIKNRLFSIYAELGAASEDKVIVVAGIAGDGFRKRNWLEVAERFDNEKGLKFEILTASKANRQIINTAMDIQGLRQLSMRHGLELFIIPVPDEASVRTAWLELMSTE